MKRFFTFRLLLVFLPTLLTFTSNAQSSIEYIFTTTPVLLSGVQNQVNSQYRFANVALGTDAIVTIASATGGATVAIIDDNTISKPNGFSPKIALPTNGIGKVNFTISFVLANTLTAISLPTLSITAYDIDGNAGLYEIDELDLGNGGVATFETTPQEISLVRDGSKFIATNAAGIEYTSIDTFAKQVMLTVRNINVQSFTYSCGANNIDNNSTERQKSIYFKSFTYDTPGTLAVKYSFFNASLYNNGVQLNWATSYEKDNDYFEVERSFDGTSFSSIGLVLDAESVINNNKNYRFKDNAAILSQKDVVYYRLKQVDIYSKIAYSTVIAVRLKVKEDVKIQTAPNPFTNKLVVSFTSNSTQQAIVKIVNAAGQVALTQQSTIYKGYNNLSVNNIAQLPAGIYVAQLTINNQLVGSQKIIKQ